jgi:hypothetical protein
MLVGVPILAKVRRKMYYFSKNKSKQGNKKQNRTPTCTFPLGKHEYTIT